MTLPLRKSRLPKAEKILPYLNEIDGNQWYSNFGPLVRRLEASLEDKFGVPEGGVLTVASATAGLQLVLGYLASGTNSTGKCAIPGFAFPAVGCVTEASAFAPVISDVAEESWQLEPSSIPAPLLSDLAAVIPVSCFGAPLDIDNWSAFAAENEIAVLFDAAWCFGSLTPARMPSVVSLHATKVLGVGEGGFVISTDVDLMADLRRRANFGLGDERLVECGRGTNAKMSEYAAAVALAALDEWPESERAAKKLASRYLERLCEIEGIDVLPGFDGSWASAALAVRFPAECVTPVSMALSAYQIESRKWWSPDLAANPAYRDWPLADDIAVSKALAREVLNIPFHEYVTEEHVDIIAAAIKTVVAG